MNEPENEPASWVVAANAMLDSDRADLISKVRDSYQDGEIDDADLDNKIYLLCGEHFAEMPTEELLALLGDDDEAVSS